MDLCGRISFRFEIQLRTGEWGWIETMNKRLAVTMAAVGKSMQLGQFGQPGRVGQL